MSESMARARRLLEVVASPGDGVLLRDGKLVLETGDHDVCAELFELALDAETPCTVRLGPLVACVQSLERYTLAVAVQHAVLTPAIHERIEKGLTLFAGPEGARRTTWPDGGGSPPPEGSGAPAELGLLPPARKS